MSLLRDLLDQENHQGLGLTEVVKLQNRGPYDLVEKDKSKLLITIGDSWTYGYRLSDEFLSDQDQERVRHCFGYLLANYYDADFLNWSFPSTNNLWMMEKYKNLVKLADVLDYKEIFVFISFTEYGREIWTDFDGDPDLNERYKQSQSPKHQAKILANWLSEQMLQHRHSKIKLVCGLTYVNNIFSQEFQPYFLDQSWIELLKDQRFADECLVIGSWVIDKYKLLLREYNQSADQTRFKTEIIEMIDQAEKRYNFIYSSEFNHKSGYGHPTVKGHSLWAEYLIQNKVFG